MGAMTGSTARALGAADGASRRLAGFVVESRWEDIPRPVRAHAVRSILNGFGTALGGARDAAVVRLLATLAPFSSGPSSTLIGNPTRVDMPTAAFLNAVAINVFDFDDTHENTIIHPTAPVAAALFAAAERYPTTGADLLHAFVLGVEVECRIGNAVSPGHYARGWHITSTCGAFGAAAAVGKLLGLEPREMLWALGNASAQSSGLVETLGFMAKSVGVGNAARSGLLAALMARNGVEGPPCPLEGPRGFLAVTSDAPDAAALTTGLGERWELLANLLKPYPCGVVLNPVIDAALAARGDPRFAPDAVRRITVAGHPLLRARADRPNVSTGREAQVSAQHAIAVALLRGAAGVGEFSDASVRAGDVAALRAKVAGVAVVPDVPIEGARLGIDLVDGGAIDVVVDAATGSAKKPLTDADIVRKFEDLAAYGCPGFDPGPLLERLWQLDSAADAGAVVRMSAPGPSGRETC
jgi:2-methylcitrate dehydratase PrpD